VNKRIFKNKNLTFGEFGVKSTLTMALQKEGLNENQNFVSRAWYNFRKWAGEILIEPMEDPHAFDNSEIPVPEIKTSKDLKTAVENNLVGMGPKLDTLNDDWRDTVITLTTVNLLENIFIDSGVTDKKGVTKYFIQKIYGREYSSSADYPQVDEIQSAIDIGYAEIPDFGLKLNQELKKHATGELYHNGTRHDP